MDRKTIRAILADETLDESAKVSRLLQMHHDEVADIKSGLKTDGRGRNGCRCGGVKERTQGGKGRGNRGIQKATARA